LISGSNLVRDLYLAINRQKSLFKYCSTNYNCQKPEARSQKPEARSQKPEAKCYNNS
jgi:hypothetical protein